MGYEWMGRLHAALVRRAHSPAGRGSGGQGTVEYVGLILLIAVVVAGVVKASGSIGDKGIAESIVKQLKGAVDGVGKG